MRSTTSYEELVGNLVHDLRQPLANIETSLCFLDLVLDRPAGRVGEQLRAMELQVAKAAQLLQSAVDEVRALRGERVADDCAASLPLTNSTTAGVA
jgi:signal transduction histidine kinase